MCYFMNIESALTVLHLRKDSLVNTDFAFKKSKKTDPFKTSTKAAFVER
jgi:hypothetical protein